MRISTKVTLDIQTLDIISRESYEYSGSVDLCKKGREIVEQNAKTDQENAKRQRGNEQSSYAQAQSNLKPYNDMGPAGMTSAASAQLAADNDNINRTYNGLREQSFRTLGQRGFGNAPSGFGLAAENGIDRGQDQSQTAAFRNAQLNSQNQRNFATQEEGKLSGQEGNLGGQSSGESTSAAVARSKMGSTFGDIMGGIAQIAPIAAAPFTGGASLALSGGGGFSNPFSKIGKPQNYGASNESGIGSYGG